MRARSFFYVSLGVLALVIAYGLGSQHATAQTVGFRVLNTDGVVIESGGTVYRLDLFLGWVPVNPSTLPPVSPSSLVAGNGPNWVDQSGTGWYQNGSTHVWASYPLPGGTPTVRTSFGGVKARYR